MTMKTIIFKMGEDLLIYKHLTYTLCFYKNRSLKFGEKLRTN